MSDYGYSVTKSCTVDASVGHPYPHQWAISSMKLSCRETWYSGTLINEGPSDWQNMFTLTRFRCIEVLLYTFYYCWGKEYYLLYRGLCYTVYRGLLNQGSKYTVQNDKHSYHDCLQVHLIERIGHYMTSGLSEDQSELRVVLKIQLLL